jgi:hypothetical protein
MTKIGRPSKGDRRKVSIGLESDLYREVKVHCAVNDLEMSSLLADAISQWWSNNPARKAAQDRIKKEVVTQPEEATKKKSGKRLEGFYLWQVLEQSMQALPHGHSFLQLGPLE